MLPLWLTFSSSSAAPWWLDVGWKDERFSFPFDTMQIFEETLRCQNPTESRCCALVIVYFTTCAGLLPPLHRTLVALIFAVATRALCLTTTRPSTIGTSGGHYTAHTHTRTHAPFNQLVRLGYGSVRAIAHQQNTFDSWLHTESARAGWLAAICLLFYVVSVLRNNRAKGFFAHDERTTATRFGSLQAGNNTLECRTQCCGRQQ